MPYGPLADLVLLSHLAYVAFVVAGGLLVVFWPRVAWAHVPCVLWGAWVELAGRICPLTPLEIDLRQRAGGEGYAGGFLDHYLVPILYPSGLTRSIQIGLGIAVLVVNLAFYGWAWRRRASQTLAPNAPNAD